MKKNIWILCLVIFIGMPSISNAQNYSSSIKLIKEAVEAKAASFVKALSDYKMSEAGLAEAKLAMDDIKIKQSETVRDFVIVNPPADIDGSLTLKASELSQWNAVADQTENLEGFMSEITTASMILNDNSLNSAESGVIKNIDKALDDQAKYNSSVIYFPKTYRDTSGGATLVESELLDAINFRTTVVSPYNTEDTTDFLSDNRGGETGTDYLARVSRKSLVSGILNSSINMRTSIKGAGLGSYIKARMKQLNDDTGNNWFKDMPLAYRPDLYEESPEYDIGGVPDDISKYEFMDLLFYQMPMNPAWDISLAQSPPKVLERKKIEMYAYLSMMNLEISKMMQKLAALDAVELARSND